MIINEAELRAALGLMPTMSDTEMARLMLAMVGGHAAIKKFLKYDPEQRVGNAELYPRNDTLGDGDLEGEWDINPTHTRAVFEARRGFHKYLQLARIPIRAISDLRVDPSAKFGQQSGDFASSTQWSQGTEYAVEWDEEGVCRSGCLIATGAWPSSPGTVRVTYRAGYSPLEFAGAATSDETDGAGIMTKAGVDASPIKAGTLIACMAKYHTLASWSKSQLTGVLTPGPKASERMGDYSYTLADGARAALITGMGLELPPEAAQYLEEFRHYGLIALG